ncbi:serine/threonine-protein kinase [Streptomyces sp. 4N509B]|uniref:serine/threonine-protein kinase n=1 Tax=Streptomyces sp. 4N509B TaxID=3457413 RepID=UPI003FD6BEA8
MEPLTPQDPHRIGPYRLLARLGEGGMGTVYLARSDRGRTVAVKTIIGQLAQEPDFRQRFAQEITAAQRVGGQWTAPVLDADTQAATPWVATGYIAGPSLHQVVARDHGPLPERTVTLLAGGLAQALKAIHGAGLLHRDLKPSNVLVTIDGPRVIDFGIARALETAPGEGLTRTGATVGSPGFMSPEQVRGQRLSPASDVFCLGTMLAFATTGRTPFGNLDSGQHVLLFRIAEEEPDLTDVPERLRHLISACLAKDPAQRPTVDDLLGYPAPGAGGVAAADGEPWLPGSLVAQLGREAVSLLDSESPETQNIPRVDLPTSPPPPSQPSPSTQPYEPTQLAQPLQPQQPQQPQAPQQPTPHAQQGPGTGAMASPYGPATPYPPSQPQPQSPSASPPSGGYGYPQQASPYGPSPYGTPPPSGQQRQRRTLFIALAAVAAVALVAVVGAVALSGGDENERPGANGGSSEGGDNGGGDNGGSGGNTTPPETPIADGYLGAWYGEYGSQGEDGWKALFFDIQQGATGEAIGTSTVTYFDTTCFYEMRLESFEDNLLSYTEVATSSVPESEAQATCRDNPNVQTLELSSGGEMLWSGGGEQEATLGSSGQGGDQLVPSSLVGSWYDAYTTDEVENGLDEVTLQQGAVGDTVMWWSFTRDETTCVTENRIAGVDGERVLLSPEILIEDQSSEECSPAASSWAWVESDGTLQILWTTGPHEQPYPVYND